MNYLPHILIGIAVAVFGGECFADTDPMLIYNCRFDAPALISLSNGYTRISIPDCSVAAQPGEPQLPFYTVQLILPSASSIGGIFAEPLSAPVTLSGVWKIDFGRTPRFPGMDTVVEDVPDPAIYESVNPYPSSAVELASVQRKNGANIAILCVYPVRYLPQAGQLMFTSDVRITLMLTKDLVAARSAESQAVLADEPSPSYDYLIVSSAALMPYFQPLVELKVYEGLSVVTETMTNIVARYSGADNPEKLRNFIRDAHINWGVQYVLLGGDDNVVPVRGVYGSVGSYTDNFIPCDLYYACLDDEWNYDGDSRWGEPNDGYDGGEVDLMPEIYIGRAPVATPAETENFVAKTVASQTGMTPSFRALFAAEYFSAGLQGGDALDYIQPAFRTSRCPVVWLDDRPANESTWNTSNVIVQLNRSPLIVAHSGHADVNTVMRMTQTNVDSLTNQPPFLFYSIGCDAGEFDNFPAPDSIGEELINRNLHGAFSAVLNSRLGWYDPQDEWKYSGEFQKEFFDTLLRAGRSCVGKADRQSREALIGKVETSGSMPYRWIYMNLILFGDPHGFVDVPVTLTLPSVGTNCVVEWNSLTNNCSLYQTPDLAAVAWSCIASNIIPTPPLNRWTNTASGIDRGFYRVIGR